MNVIHRGQSASILARLESFLSYDFCPWANRWVCWIKNPLCCLVAAALISVLCGVFTNPQVFLLTGVIALVLTLGTVWPKVCIRGIRCRIEFDRRRIREQESVPVKLTISNRWPWPVWGLNLTDGFEISNEEAEQDAAVAVARVGGWSETQFVWEFRPTSRGVYPTQAPRIGTGFPFGILHAGRNVECDGSLIVWPRTVALNAMPDAADSRHCHEQLAERRAGEFGDMLGTRLFRDGDSLRRVHWAQTARQREVIVVERQATAATAVRVVLRIDHDADRETADRSIRIAASICESLYRQHAYVECLIDETLYVCHGSETEFRRLMDAFARLRVGEDIGAAGRASIRHTHSLFEIVVTTDSSRVDAERSALRRKVVVQRVGAAEHARCSSWLTVPADADWPRQLARMWRKACHAA